MNKINWAIMAPGRIAEKFALALQVVDSANLYSVASRSPARARAFAAQFGFVTSADSYDELLADPNVDVVYIASPHSLHAEQSIACIKAGKAVLCEKPMTINSMQAQQVFAAAENHHVFYMEAVWTRFMPVLRDVRKLIDEGVIGDVRAAQASFGINVAFDASNRLYNPKLAGGALLDVGIYPITFAQWLMREPPSRVCGSATIGNSKVDESNSMLLSYPSGAIATLSSSINTLMNQQAWIYGSKGSVCIPYFWRAQQAKVVTNVGEQVIEYPHKLNGYEYEIEEVNACLFAGHIQSAVMNWQESLQIMNIMDEVRRQIGLIYCDDVENA